jgi:hypothetical protein
MSDIADTTVQLQRLVRLIMKETDHARFDELASEIWRVLDERERLKRIGVQSAEVPASRVA